MNDLIGTKILLGKGGFYFLHYDGSGKVYDCRKDGQFFSSKKQAQQYIDGVYNAYKKKTDNEPE